MVVWWRRWRFWLLEVGLLAAAALGVRWWVGSWTASLILAAGWIGGGLGEYMRERRRAEAALPDAERGSRARRLRSWLAEVAVVAAAALVVRWWEGSWELAWILIAGWIGGSIEDFARGGGSGGNDAEPGSPKTPGLAAPSEVRLDLVGGR